MQDKILKVDKDFLEHFTDPINSYLFKDPITTKCGHTFEKETFEEHLAMHETCPECNGEVKRDTGYVANLRLQKSMEEFLKSNPDLRKDQYIPHAEALKIRNRLLLQPDPMAVVAWLRDHPDRVLSHFADKLSFMEAAFLERRGDVIYALLKWFDRSFKSIQVCTNIYDNYFDGHLFWEFFSHAAENAKIQLWLRDKVINDKNLQHNIAWLEKRENQPKHIFSDGLSFLHAAILSKNDGLVNLLLEADTKLDLDINLSVFGIRPFACILKEAADLKSHSKTVDGQIKILHLILQRIDFDFNALSNIDDYSETLQTYVEIAEVLKIPEFIPLIRFYQDLQKPQDSKLKNSDTDFLNECFATYYAELYNYFKGEKFLACFPAFKNKDLENDCLSKLLPGVIKEALRTQDWILIMKFLSLPKELLDFTALVHLGLVNKDQHFVQTMFNKISLENLDPKLVFAESLELLHIYNGWFIYQASQTCLSQMSSMWNRAEDRQPDSAVTPQISLTPSPL